MRYKFALDEEVPQKIVAEIEQFRQWLQPIVTAQNVCCPFCGSHNIRHSHKINPNTLRGRNGRICNQCYKDFSILHGTPLYKAKRLEQYLTYFELLLKGVGDVEIWKIVGISCRTTQRWWFLLTEQMQKMNLNVLIDWIIWRQIAHERHIHFLSHKVRKEEPQRIKNIERHNALQKNQKNQDTL